MFQLDAILQHYLQEAVAIPKNKEGDRTELALFMKPARDTNGASGVIRELGRKDPLQRKRGGVANHIDLFHECVDGFASPYEPATQGRTSRGATLRRRAVTTAASRSTNMDLAR